MTRSTRREFLQRSAVVGAGALALPSLAGAATRAAGAAHADSKTLTISNCPLYIDIDEKTKRHPSLDAFTKKTGVKVKYLEDVNDNIPDVDMAINSGDVVHFPTEESYDLYIKTRDASYIKEWHEIIGNHDYKTDKGKIFQAKLKENPNYTVEKGNILFIFMSNEDRGKATVITDETFEW